MSKQSGFALERDFKTADIYSSPSEEFKCVKARLEIILTESKDPTGVQQLLYQQR